jgi:hypothetical protein
MLEFSRYRFNFSALDPVTLPAFAGSALRGILGHGLRRTVCVTAMDDCKDCPLHKQCAYTQLFETQLASGQKGLTLQPVILSLDHYAPCYAPGEPFSLQLTLIGSANRHLPYLVPAWQRAGHRGLGRANAKFQLEQIERLDFGSNQWRHLYPSEASRWNLDSDDRPWQPDSTLQPQRIRVEWLTPYRSKKEGRLVTQTSFDAPGFLISVARRIEALRRQFDSRKPALPMAQLVASANVIRLVDAQLDWQEITRHSSRQQSTMNLGGVIGSFCLEGDCLPQYYPLLQLGQWLHAGKNSLFGLGRYQLTPLEDSHG